MAEVTRADIDQLAEKLEAFAAGLDDRERDILAHLVDKATGEADVSGFDGGTPLTSSLSTSLAGTSISDGFSVQLFPNLNHKGSSISKPSSHDVVEQ